MSWATVGYGVADGVATITLNRPEKFNAFNTQMHADLQAALREAEKDPAVRCVVITGAGRAFCAGQDLGDMGGLPAGDLVRQYYNPLIQRIRSLEKPVVAAINGPAAGAGLSLALACDLRVAAESATFTTAFANVGLVPDSGLSYFLPRMVGLARAMDLCLLADKFTAADAERWGLVSRVWPDAEFPARWRDLAARLGRGPRAQGWIKRLLTRSLTNNLEEQLELEAWMQQLAAGTADAQEGIQAFREKRPPQFRGA